MDNPEADPITLADLADAQRSLRSHRCGDPMAVAQPADHADGEAFAGRTPQALGVEPVRDGAVVEGLGQAPQARDEGLGITDDVGPPRRQGQLQSLRGPALPAQVQAQPLRLRSPGDRDVADQEAQQALAVQVGGR